MSKEKIDWQFLQGVDWHFFISSVLNPTMPGHVEKGLRWQVRMRMRFIARRLRSKGFINRHHLVTQFGISPVQAAKDFQLFKLFYPDALIYDARNKRYELGFRYEKWDRV